MAENSISKASENAQRRSANRAALVRELFPLIGLIVIFIFFAIFTNGRILKPAAAKLILSQVYVPMIASSGVFLIMTVGGLDFSQGSLLGIVSIVISYLSFYSIPLAVIAGVATGAAIGAFNGLFHVRFKIPSFIVTMCSMFLFRGFCAYFTTNAPVAASREITDLNLDGLKIATVIVVLLILFFIFTFTKVGINLKAIGAGEKAARFAGIRTDLTKFMVFMSAGAITGIAAFLNVIRVGSITATAGNQLETQILISLVLGGMPISGGAKVRFSNIIVGSLIYAILNNGLVMMRYDTAIQQLIKGVIFLAVVALTIDRKAIRVIK